MTIRLHPTPKHHNLDCLSAQYLARNNYGTAIRRPSWPPCDFIALVNNAPPFMFTGRLPGTLVLARFQGCDDVNHATVDIHLSEEDYLTYDWELYETTQSLSKDDVSFMVAHSPTST